MTRRDTDFHEAATFAEQLADRLNQRLGPMDVAGVLIGTGTDWLVQALGREGAVHYLREMASELEAAKSAAINGMTLN